jgi:hypothetical protein
MAQQKTDAEMLILYYYCLSVSTVGLVLSAFLDVRLGHPHNQVQAEQQERKCSSCEQLRGVPTRCKEAQEQT